MRRRLNPRPHVVAGIALFVRFLANNHATSKLSEDVQQNHPNPLLVEIPNQKA
jgi:hypothetical protein